MWGLAAARGRREARREGGREGTSPSWFQGPANPAVGRSPQPRTGCESTREARGCQEIHILSWGTLDSPCWASLCARPLSKEEV